jgi:hypothetical protein
MSEMNRYRMRAECLIDLTRALLKLGKEPGYLNATIVRGSRIVPDCQMTVETELSINDVRALLLEVVDGHVMYESVDEEEHYTGKRYWKVSGVDDESTTHN